MTTDLNNPAWPYLVFAEQLNADIAKFAEAKEAYVNWQGIPQSDTIHDPMATAQVLMSANGTIMERLPTILSAERVVDAFGNAAHPSHEDKIRAVADDMINTVYGQLITWARTCLGYDVPEAYRPLYKALANLMSRPIRDFEDFAADVTKRANTIDADLKAGREPSVNFSLTIKPTVDDQDMRMYNEAIDGLRAQPPQRRGFFRRR